MLVCVAEQLLSQISKQRGSAEEDWMAVAVAMAAINVSLGNMKNNKLFTVRCSRCADGPMGCSRRVATVPGLS